MEKNNNHKSGFKVPKDYFESFEHRLSENTDFVISTKQSSSEKQSESGFVIPDNYLNSLTEEILNTSNTEKPKNKVIPLYNNRKLLMAISVAATIAIIFTTTFLKKDTLTIDDIEIADIYTYFDEGNIDMSNSEMIALLAEDMDNTELFDEDIIINDESLLEYISEEDLQDEIIFEE
ncbi:hypothetical protein [Aquimarina algicola]|uniref:Uncharacterized protein n=1 Tax=Aquimarina algicola TaxID=2589995 RepID=A0A504J3T4_9FLAO|nr:hypothetical protein [Aquimarina algicola]TPN85094.1 hypothetical protein FHK87_13770 [Aquimarina algicola]